MFSFRSNCRWTKAKAKRNDFDIEVRCLVRVFPWSQFGNMNLSLIANECVISEKTHVRVIKYAWLIQRISFRRRIFEKLERFFESRQKENIFISISMQRINSKSLTHQEAAQSSSCSGRHGKEIIIPMLFSLICWSHFLGLRLWMAERTMQSLELFHSSDAPVVNDLSLGSREGPFKINWTRVMEFP